MPTHAPSRRALGAVALTTGLLVLSAGAASAHVSVHADSSAPGSWTQLTFRVPTESTTAATTKLVITLPQDTPLAHVSTKPVDGWTVAVQEAPLPTPVQLPGGATLTKAAHTVTWQGDAAHSIKPGEYQEFSISAGPLPGTGTLLFPADQYYSDGSVVHWNQPAAAGTHPEHPAPSLTITAATATDASHTSADVTHASAAGASTTDPTGDTTARWLSGAALVVAAGALGVGVLGLRRRRDVTGSSVAS